MKKVLSSLALIIGILLIIILIIVISRLVKSNQPTSLPTAPTENVSEEVVEEEPADSTDLVHPPAPGKWDATAVVDNLPEILATGTQTLALQVRGYMFFEGVAHYEIYDAADGTPIAHGAVMAQEDAMSTNYISAVAGFTLPSSLTGHRIIFRVINDNPTGDASFTKYWSKVMKVQ
jgi:hypothetical protein